MEVERQNFSSAADVLQKMICCSVVDTFFATQRALVLMLSMSGALLSEANMSNFPLDANKSFLLSDVKETSVTEENKDAGETGGGKFFYSDSDSSNESGDEYDEVENYDDSSDESNDDDGAPLFGIPGSDEDDDSDDDDDDDDDEDDEDEENDDEDEEKDADEGKEEEEDEEGGSDGKKEKKALKKKSEKQLDSQSLDPTTSSV